jgi:16S rRNA (guanine966-N2)-methyltransferase
MTLSRKSRTNIALSATAERSAPPAAKSSRDATPRFASHKVRIQGGLWRKTPIPVVDVPGLRPTPDRVRETLFNWLGQDLTGQVCLDAFAGTGALGFEAASRGASQVFLFESDLKAARQMSDLKLKLKADQVSIFAADVLLGLSRVGRHSLDIVFLDPPFDSGLIAKILPRLISSLKDQAYIYVEAEMLVDEAFLRSINDTITSGGPKADALTLYRQARAGNVYYHLLEFDRHREALA